MTDYHRLSMLVSLVSTILIIVVLVLSCGNEKSIKQDEEILVKVGDLSITVDEFMRRAEMTIRPVYCNRDNNLHKKIILNSLIAEKMFALEVGELNDFGHEWQLKFLIQGRQEQAMREWLLHKEGYEKVHLRESEIQEIYKVAGRTYQIQYYNIPSDDIASIFKREINKNEGFFKELYEQLWHNKEIPKREVAWIAKENPLIHNELFSDSVTKDQIIGPIRISEDDHVVIKVVGWKDKLAVSEEDQKQRWNDVKAKITTERALQIYDSFVVGIMEGKRLEFAAKTFNKIIGLLGPFYVQSQEARQKLFYDAMFNQHKESIELAGLEYGINQILNEPFFSVDGQTWTVRDFKQELQRHPLVFRSNMPEDAKFAEHLKYAIIDMIRDKYLTEEAYKRGYDKVNAVKRYTNMWNDALIAQYHRNEYLRKFIPTPTDTIHTVTIIEKYLNPYVDDLQEKYNNQIEVNIESFNNISLTRIDMIVVQKNVPFPVMVPSFPQITTDAKLDYGKKME
jgi:hypothetical protein